MSVYHLPTLAAALAVIALGATCTNIVGEGDKCGTDVYESGADSVKLYLLQKDIKLAKTLQQTAVQENARVSKSVAIFVSGSLVRFQADSSATHLVSPLLQAGYQVDYYIHLNTEAFKGFSGRSSSYAMDQRFQGLEGQQLEQAITQPFANAGATVRKLVLTREGSANASKGEQAFEDGTSDLGSLMWRDGSVRQDDGPAARQNWLRRQRGLQQLWTEATALEQRKRNQYAFVITLVDDAVWFHDFDTTLLLGSKVVEMDAYSLSCGLGSSFPILAGSRLLNDFIFILERQIAVPFLTTYSLMLKPQAYPEYVHNSESFYFWLSDHYNVHMLQVPTSKIRFQRVARAQVAGEILQCYHYLCKAPDSDSSHLFPSFPQCSE